MLSQHSYARGHRGTKNTPVCHLFCIYTNEQCHLSGMLNSRGALYGAEERLIRYCMYSGVLHYCLLWKA